MRLWEGNIPGEGWMRVAEVCVEDEEWVVFAHAQAHTDAWVTYKICAKGRVAHKANYWMTKNMQTGRFGKGADIKIMRDNRPELWDAIRDWV